MICSVCLKEPANDRVTLTSSGNEGKLTLWVGDACQSDYQTDGTLAVDWWLSRMIQRQQRILSLLVPHNPANTDNPIPDPLDVG